jgi:hypothetical protein
MELNSCFPSHRQQQFQRRHIVLPAAIITDFIPDAHTLFIVVQATLSGKPA